MNISDSIGRYLRVGTVTLLLLVSLAASNKLFASCNCICVNGLNRPLCSSISDRRPVCPPRVCPREPAISRPLDQSRLPSTATQTCTDKYVFNRYSQAYEWRRFCR